MKKSGLVGGIFAMLFLIVVAILLIFCTEKVPAGYVGVVYNMNGGIEGDTLSQGWHIISPTEKVTTYSIGIEQSYLTSEKKGDSPHDESFSIPTSDGKTVKVDLEFSYRFDAERVPQTFITFKGRSGEDIKDTFIKPKIIAWTQEVSAGYPVTDIFGDKRTAINAELDTYLKAKFDPYGILIDTVNFTDISVDDETAEAIQKKVTAQQELELAQIEAQTAKIEANKEKEVAEIAAETKKIDAQGEADATLIAAEAEAQANSKIAASLTPELNEKIKYEKWNGELPTVSTGNNGSVIVSMSDDGEPSDAE